MPYQPIIVDEELWCQGCSAKHLCLQGFKYVADCTSFKFIILEMGIRPWENAKTNWVEIFGN